MSRYSVCRTADVYASSSKYPLSPSLAAWLNRNYISAFLSNRDRGATCHRNVTSQLQFRELRSTSLFRCSASELKKEISRLLSPLVFTPQFVIGHQRIIKQHTTTFNSYSACLPVCYSLTARFPLRHKTI
jgi:hypothetical protein